MEIIRAEQISKRFDDTFNLGPLDFRLEAGEVLAVAGASGAGKTTLLKLVWGFVRPDKGHLAIFGLQPHLNQLRVRRVAGYLSQNPQCDLGCTARQLLRFVGHFYDGFQETDACALLTLLDIDPDINVRMLSKGDRVKVGIVAAASHRPALLLLDEPVSAVDSVARFDILHFLRRLAREKRTSMLVSCLNPDDLGCLADRIVTLPLANNPEETR